MIRTLRIILAIIIAIAIGYYLLRHRSVLSIIRNSKKETPLTIDIQAIKPAQWQTFGKHGFIKINVDHDNDAEWLFLYRDTGDTNQIGGVIYDAQNQPKGAAAMDASQHAPANLTPYRLMPDYTTGKSRGYLGDDNVEYQAVSEVSGQAKKSEKSKKDAAPTGDYLQMRGYFRQRTNRFSVFWWLDAQRGYGGTQANTPGWFSLSRENPNEWSLWQSDKKGNGQLISELWAWEPQTDRSNICRRALWRLTGDKEQNTMQFIPDYEHSDLVFCKGSPPPAEPAFPEAQVLAYLLDKSQDRWQENATPTPFENVMVNHINVPEINADTTVVDVFVDFWADGEPYKMFWKVKMEPPANLRSSTHWRIVSAVLAD